MLKIRTFGQIFEQKLYIDWTNLTGRRHPHFTTSAKIGQDFLKDGAQPPM